MDTGSNNTNIDSHCYDDYFQAKYYGQVAFRAGFSFVTTFFILTMLGIIVLFKKYLFFTQRLIMYVALTQLFFSIVATMDVLSIEAYRNTEALNYCRAIALATFITLWWTALSVTVMVIDIFLKIVFAKDTERYEVLYGVIIVVPPLIVSWIPFINKAYGSAIHACFIKVDNGDDCKEFPLGIWLRLALYIGPLCLVTAIIIIMLIIVFIVARRSKYSGKYDPATRIRKAQIIKEMKPLIAYPIIFTACTVISIAITGTGALEPTSDYNYIVTVLTTIVYRLQAILITLVFTLDPETRRKLTWQEIRAAFCAKKVVKQYHRASKARSDSYDPASRQNVQEYKEIEYVQYTGEHV